MDYAMLFVEYKKSFKVKWEKNCLLSVAQRTLGKRAMEGHVARCLPSSIICQVFFPYLPSAGVCRVFFSRIAKCQNVCRVFFSKALGKQRVCRVSEFLPSVFSLALGKEMVCRVSAKKHLAKNMTLGKAFDSGNACMLCWMNMNS